MVVVKIAAGLALAVLVAGALALRPVLQWREAQDLAIISPDGIGESAFVEVGGVPP